MKSYSEVKAAISEIGKTINTLPESVQHKAFDILLNLFLENKSPSFVKPSSPTLPKKTALKEKKTRKKGSGSKESFHLDKNLKLKGDNKIPSFIQFVEEKNPTSNIQFNAVAVYYLRKILGMANINIDKIYTCYKEVGRKVPGNMLQSIHDTSSSRYGYIDLSNGDDISIPTRGETFVEHDLPKKAK